MDIAIEKGTEIRNLSIEKRKMLGNNIEYAIYGTYESMKCLIFLVIRNPFGNCQTYSIAYFNQIRSYNFPLILCLMYAQILGRKKQLILDISTEVLNHLKKHIGEEHIKAVTPYVNSTYKTNMNIVIINTDFIDSLVRKSRISKTVSFELIDKVNAMQFSQ